MTLHSALPSRCPRGLCAPIAALALAASLVGCGGGGGSAGSSPGPSPAPPVAGPAWRGFASDPQHSALAAIASQDLNRIAWSTPIDLAPAYTPNGDLLVHYGSPVITSHNTVVVPVKTGRAGGFRLEARSGTNGGLIWWANSDYVLPPSRWVPSYNVALTTGNRLFAPAIGGKLLVKDDADASGGTLRTLVFYGADAYNSAPATFDATVFVNTPITVDTQGNVVLRLLRRRRESARAGERRRARRGRRHGPVARRERRRRRPDGRQGRDEQRAGTLARRGDALRRRQRQARLRAPCRAATCSPSTAAASRSRARALLRDPSTGTPARVSDDGTASPTVGPDGDVYFGVLEANFGSHNAPRLAAPLQRRRWRRPRCRAASAGTTPPRSCRRRLVPSYTGGSSYLLMIKYNNYAGIGTGDGANRIAIVDPRASQVDPISGLPIMKEVLTILGPTFESGTSGPVREWCINTAAVDPLTRSVLVNSEDGVLYRWDLTTNRLSQKIRLTAGLGEAYTPTAIGADGAVYAINDSVLFAVGR